MARLIVKSGSAERTIELDPRTPVGVGRDAANELPLPEEGLGISRRHCRLAPTPRGGHVAWEVSDLGATNKTRVNGRTVDKQVLSHGDLIQVGKVELLFEDPAEEERLRAAGSRGVCFLEWVSGPKRGEKVLLDAARSTLGRRESSTIVLDDRMASGHHAEITKDLNGYTLRDLGSTNGTLVNGEPVTEMALTHGTRIRIGSSKFVFKDPSMKDIEVELSQFEDDEGWGMMADIDLTRARGSRLGLVVGLLLLAGVGAGGWVLMQEEAGTTGEATVDINFVADGGMESETAAGLWDPLAPDQAVEKRQIAGRSGQALRLSYDEGGRGDAIVAYAEEFATGPRPFRVRADLRGEGDLVAVWSNVTGGEGAAAAGAGSRLSLTVPLGAGRVDAVLDPPAWAWSLRLGVRLAPGASATLDDVDVEYAEEPGRGRAELAPPGESRATWRPRAGLDLITVQTVLVAGAVPVVRLPGGEILARFVPDPDGIEADAERLAVQGAFEDGPEPVPARWSWTRTEEGLAFECECAGAAAVGLDLGLLHAHLSEGVNLFTETGARTLAAAPGQTVSGVLKCLAGDPRGEGGRARTLVTVVPTAAPQASGLELHAGPDPALLRLRFLSPGAAAGYALLTNFEVQQRAAQDRLQAARALGGRRPAEAIDALRALAQEFPFLRALRDDALQQADELERRARQEIDAFAEAVDEFEIFAGAEELARAEERGQALLERFPGRGEASGALEQDVAALAARLAERRAEYLLENAGKELGRLARLAGLLADTEGYRPMAVIYYREIVRRFGWLEADERFASLVRGARDAITQLTQDPRVAASVPELPPAAAAR